MKTATLITLLFSVWLTHRIPQQKSPTESVSRMDAGKAVYEAFACHSCHGDDGAMLGDLTRAGEKYSDEEMIKYIKNPRAFDNRQMPVYEGVIPDKDFDDLIWYIRYLGEKTKQ
ncbi:MAG: cytochrome c [Cryomorphaceae bacterium]|nr:cytochrome c [Cryomorphaceae bacterium]